MINLLPTGEKEEMFYARRNTTLLKWVVALAVSSVGVLVIVLAGNIFLQISINNYSSETTEAKERLQSQKIEETQKQIEEISGNTKLATQVLSREILFSKLLRQLGASIPSNTVLQQFQVEKLGGGLTLQAAATDINAATQLQLNLQDPQNKIFEKADIENITCGQAELSKKYPCVIQLKALFSDKNTFTFIGQSEDNSQ
jgi:Tfp pilus assembly protein PilN